MKKVLLFVFALFVFNFVSAQSFGIKAGFNSTTMKVKVFGASVSDNASGFYLGALAEFELADKVNLQPELQYVYLSKDGENTSFINVPVMLNYYVAEPFAIQFGPQLSYQLEDSVTDYTNLGIGLALGAKYMFTENIFADARYSMDLNNHYTGSDSSDFSAKYNAFQVGLGYKF